MANLKFLADKSLIPNDGSIDIIEGFSHNLKNTDIIIYPDVHYKKGSRSVNGLLVSSNAKIFPAVIGTPNCGFTFGKVENVSTKDRKELEKTFDDFSKVLKAYPSKNQACLTMDETLAWLEFKIERNFETDKDFFDYLGINSVNDGKELIYKVLTPDMIELASKSLGTLGGGNHFFELHSVEESYVNFELAKGDMAFILHSDSVSIGNLISLIFSNLSELDYLSSYNALFTKLTYRFKQFQYFSKNWRIALANPMELIKLLLSRNDYRYISSNKKLGRHLLASFYVASLFGDINRSLILENYLKIARQVIVAIDLNILGNHSHDTIKAEKIDNRYKIVHRNGVQHIGNDSIYVLTGALGTESYIMKNTYNKDAFYSVNHGVGRIFNKSLSKNMYSEEATKKELEKSGLKFYRIGNESVAAQHPKSFKNIEDIIQNMLDECLGFRIAKLKPICSIKA